MAKTCNSAATPYATPADYLVRVNVNLTGDLVRDDGGQATPTQLLTDPALAAALADASGLVEMTAQTGGRYSAADLQALTGNGQALLKRIVCGLAVQFLRDRLGVLEQSQYPLYKEAQAWLEALGTGAAVFPFVETVAACVPKTVAITAADLSNRTPALFTNQSRYWGVTSDRAGGAQF